MFFKIIVVFFDHEAFWVLSQNLSGWAIIANLGIKNPDDPFKGTHYPKDVILYAVFFYVRYAVSYRDLEDILEERGVSVDHATLNRWLIKYSASLALMAKKRKSSVSASPPYVSAQMLPLVRKED